MSAIETALTELSANLRRMEQRHQATGYKFDRLYGLIDAAREELAGLTAPTDLSGLLKGMSVSVDVSTGDHDSGNRYFGTVTEVMEAELDKHGVTLLVQDAEPNFTP